MCATRDPWKIRNEFAIKALLKEGSVTVERWVGVGGELVAGRRNANTFTTEEAAVKRASEYQGLDLVVVELVYKFDGEVK